MVLVTRTYVLVLVLGFPLFSFGFRENLPGPQLQDTVLYRSKGLIYT